MQQVQQVQQGHHLQHGQQADLQGAPSWGKAEADAGSDPPSVSLASLAGHSQGHSLASLAGHSQGHSLASHSVGGSGQLAHAESAGFSSWGLPSPSTGKRAAQPCCSSYLGHAAAQLSDMCSRLAVVGAQLPRTVHQPDSPCLLAATAHTPFNSLSRFNSLAGSAQYSPQAGQRPALPFAFAGQQQQHGLQQLGGGGSAAHAPWAGIPPFTAGAHPAGRGAAGGSGSGSGHSSARGDGEVWQAGAISDVAPMGPELISPMAMGILGGLGISVS